MFSVANLLIGWKVKLIAAGVFVMTVLGFIFKLKRDAFNQGKKAANDVIQKENERVRDAWKKIDDTPSTVDESLERLRKRSRDKGYNS